MVFTVIAYLLLAALAIMGAGILLSPFYLWALWSTNRELDEARRAGLID